MRTGIIYMATAPSGGMYIGQTVQDISRRQYIHKNHHKYGGGNVALNRAIAKYGESAIEWRILAVVGEDFLGDVEQFYIAEKRKEGARLYNETDGGAHGKYSADARRRMSLAKIGKPAPWARKPKSAEHCAKISATLTGRPGPNKGKPVPPHVREKISATLTGRKLSPEHIANRSAAQRGKKMPPRTAEWSEKQSASKKGKPWSKARREAQNNKGE